MTPLERALVAATRWLVPSLLVAAAGLAITSSDLLATTTLHLSAIVVGTLLLALRLAPSVDQPWFAGVALRSRWGTAASVAALVTGYAALVTLASSAALRFDPSLQFLQLLSALDIAWVVAATVVGARWLWGPRWSIAAGTAMSVICVWSIWRYLDEVGFGPDGQWIVDGEALRRLVLPPDTIAALIAVTLVALGARQVTAHPNPQS